MQKIYFALKMFVIIRMLIYICTVQRKLDVFNNDWASHLAFHIQVVRKVMHNFTNSFMKHPPDVFSFQV